MNSKYRITMGGAPNFAYDLCVAKTTPEEREGLDLSAWRVAFNGAEPVQYASLRRFEEASHPTALPNKPSVRATDGETTLMVTGSGPRKSWQSLAVDAHALRNNKIAPVDPANHSNPQMLVSSGWVNDDFD